MCADMIFFVAEIKMLSEVLCIAGCQRDDDYFDCNGNINVTEFYARYDPSTMSYWLG